MSYHITNISKIIKNMLLYSKRNICSRMREITIGYRVHRAQILLPDFCSRYIRQCIFYEFSKSTNKKTYVDIVVILIFFGGQ